jgi:hypothetical protein
MTYNLIIKIDGSDPKYVNDIDSWDKVKEILKNELPLRTIFVDIYKYSKDNKQLGHRCVSMRNLYQVATSDSDKYVLI